MRLAPAAAVTLLVLVISVKSKIADEVGTVIAIDLGRSYSRVAVPKDSSNVNIIATIPSYVSFTQDEEFVVGAEAVNQLGTNPQNTIFDMMRLIGQEWSNLNVQNDIKLYPFKVIHNNTKLLFQVSTGQDVKSFTPEEILAKVLLKLKVAAEEYLGETVEHTVVTVPAYFNEAQKQAIRDAGTIAGLHMIRILHEPSAAAIGAGLQDVEGEKHILVFDLGGRRLDVTLLNIDNGVFNVVTHWGDTHIGGQYFDDRVMDHFIKIIETKGKDIRNDNQAIQKLRKEVEEAKRSLSVTDQAIIRIESLFDEYEEPDFLDTLTRSKFEELNMDLFKSTLTSIEKVIEDGQMKKEDVDEIVLSGGSSRIPFIHQLVKEFFGGKQPVQGINPDEVVICGAAFQAAILSEEPAHSTCGWLCGYEFTRLTLGIEAVGGMMAVLIPRNARFPTKKSQIFSTATDNQSTVTIQIFEGERPLTKDNRLLYKFELAGIPAAPRGVPQIEVTFQIDPNEILHVEAEDKETGNKVDISFTSYQTRLKEEDIEQIVTDAENFFEDDKKIRETIEARNELEFYPSQQTGSYSLAPGRKRDEL